MLLLFFNAATRYLINLFILFKKAANFLRPFFLPIRIPERKCMSDIQLKKIQLKEGEDKPSVIKLKLFDTYQRKVVDFNSIKENTVGLYACGPTVYDRAHVGNLRTYLLVDFLRKTFEYNGYNVNHVMNITDVGHLVSDADSGEDKMEKGSRLQNRSAWDLALYYEQIFFEDCELIGIQKPVKVCRATDHIEEQIEYIKQLEQKGFTYQTDDGIYFDTNQLNSYGYLARLDKAGLKAGVRVDIAQKKSITDFALWKFSGQTKRQMEWLSPWGKGFPGWHIECSAMANKYLGKLFDVHVGGEDHIPVHHSNEIAQSEGCHGTKMANYWIHGYFLQFDKEKISKSGKSLLLSDLITAGYDPLAFRYLVLTTHYRSRLNFSWDSLQAAANGLTRLRRFVNSWPDGGAVSLKFQSEFSNRLNNDINTPQALALIWELVYSDVAEADKKATILEFDQVLGLSLSNHSNETAVPQQVIDLAELRQKARAQKNWKESDQLRKKIRTLGFVIDDHPEGYRLESLTRR